MRRCPGRCCRRAGVTAASSAVHSWIPPSGPRVTETGPLIRLSSGLRAASEVTGVPLTFVTEPSPLLVAGAGKAYGSPGSTVPVRVTVPEPVVTAALLVRVHKPRVLPTRLLSPLARNGTEFTNDGDMRNRDLEGFDLVDITSFSKDGSTRAVYGYRAVRYEIPRGCAAGYMPELNVLCGIANYSTQSGQPVTKHLEVEITPHQLAVPMAPGIEGSP
jgi:hypothetical protein